MKGWKLIGSTVAQIPAFLHDCEAIGPDIVQLAEWASIFTTGKANIEAVIEANLLSHKAIIGIDAGKAKLDLSGGKYFAFGDEIGTMLVILTQQPSSEMVGTDDPAGLTTKEYNEILAGFMYGILAIQTSQTRTTSKR